MWNTSAMTTTTVVQRKVQTVERLRKRMVSDPRIVAKVAESLKISTQTVYGWLAEEYLPGKDNTEKLERFLGS